MNSMGSRAAALWRHWAPAFRSDRFGPRPPADPLQRLDLPAALAAGEVDPAEVVAQWRQALPARGLAENSPVIDWLPHWDNALLDAIRPHLPQARCRRTRRHRKT